MAYGRAWVASTAFLFARNQLPQPIFQRINEVCHAFAVKTDAGVVIIGGNALVDVKPNPSINDTDFDVGLLATVSDYVNHIALFYLQPVGQPLFCSWRRTSFGPSPMKTSPCSMVPCAARRAQ